MGDRREPRWWRLWDVQLPNPLVFGVLLVPAGIAFLVAWALPGGRADEGVLGVACLGFGAVLTLLLRDQGRNRR
jgi:hypothetical protein